MTRSAKIHGAKTHTSFSRTMLEESMPPSKEDAFAFGAGLSRPRLIDVIGSAEDGPRSADIEVRANVWPHFERVKAQFKTAYGVKLEVHKFKPPNTVTITGKKQENINTAALSLMNLDLSTTKRIAVDVLGRAAILGTSGARGRELQRRHGVVLTDNGDSVDVLGNEEQVDSFLADINEIRRGMIPPDAGAAGIKAFLGKQAPQRWLPELEHGCHISRMHKKPANFAVSRPHALPTPKLGTKPRNVGPSFARSDMSRTTSLPSLL